MEGEGAPVAVEDGPRLFATTFYNATMIVTDPASIVDAPTFFLYFLIVAAAALAVIAAWRALEKGGYIRKAGKGAGGKGGAKGGKGSDGRLSLKDANAAKDAVAAELAAANATIVTLKDAEVARAAAAVSECVDEAFATYKDTRKLNDEDKADMMILARADLTRFKTRYPRVAPALQPLLRDLTGGRSVTSTTSTVPVVESTGGVGHVDMVMLSNRYKAAGMSNEDATTAAYCRAKGKTLPTSIVLPASVAGL